MFKYFTAPVDVTSYTIKKYYKFEYIKRRYQLELNKVKEYYNNKDRAVNNRHILSRLINMLAPSYTIDDFTYFTIVDTNAKFISKQFDIVSNLSKGKVLSNELYRSNSSEVLLYVEEELDLDKLKLTWMLESPLRCISTTIDNINFSFPYENVDLEEDSFSVFEIDIIKMMMMYKYWCMERINDGASTNPNVFVAKIILPNTMDSMLDMSIVNRFFIIANGNKASTDMFNPHPFHILNYTDGIDTILKDISKDIKGNSVTIDQIFQSIPSILTDDVTDTVKVKSKYFNRQSKWVLWVSKIKLVRQLLFTLGKRGRSRNKDYVNSISYTIRTMKNRDTEIESILPSDMYRQFNIELNKIKKIIKK